MQRTHTYTNNECTSVCKYVRTVCMYSIYVSCVCSEGPGQGIWMDIHVIIRECGSTLYVGMAQGVSLSLYIGIGAKFENTQKNGERRLRTAEYRTVLL